jgi:hypothetical protein
MRASNIALIAAVLSIPSIGYAQQDNGPVGGPVGGMVGPEGSLGPSLGQPRPSLGLPKGSPTRPSPVAGSSGSIAPGQVVWRQLVVGGVPQNVRITPRADGMGSAFINGQRVLVDLNTNRVLQQGNEPVGGFVGGSVGGSVGGPVGGPVGPEGSSSLGQQPRPSLGSPYGSPPRRGPVAGSSGSVSPSQIVPRNVPITPEPGGMGSAFMNGQRVLVDPNTNRIIRVLN